MIRYRLAALHDVEALVRLRLLMQLEVNSTADKTGWESFNEKSKAYFLNALARGNYHGVLALFEDRVVANAGVIFYEKPPTMSGGSGKVGYETNVYTEMEFRRKGIGTQLMRELNSLALNEGADKLHLGSTVDAKGMYNSVGYAEPRFLTLEVRSPFTNAI